MSKCIYNMPDDECTLFHGDGNESPSECDKNGLCMCLENSNWLTCDMFDVDYPDPREEEE